MRVLSKKQLDIIKQHKYVGDDRSILNKAGLGWIWTRCSRMLPFWVSPNLLTVLGFAVMVASHAFMVIECYEFVCRPSYVSSVVCFACTLLSMHFDGMDGKRAVYLDFKYPTGEVLDHALDAFTYCFMAIDLGMIAGIGISSTMWTVFGSAILNVFMSDWQARYDGVYRCAPFSSNEFMFVISCLFLLGSDWLQTPLFVSWGVSRGLFIVLLSVVGTLSDFPDHAKPVFEYVQRNKAAFLRQVLRDLSLLYPVLLFIAWTHFAQDTVNAHPFVALYAFSALASDACLRQKIAYVAKEQPPLLCASAFGVAALFVNTAVQHVVQVTLVSEVVLLHVVAIGCMVMYVGYFVCAMRDICAVCGIRFWTAQRVSQKH
eukprot:TRINITY_DN4296_c0_g1_i5.p1 TRINITY_DN4296_c0_g1~~TRINITY_DN4296_c0_g1_i5.p1  ORF type:complete len:373 (-),score=37.72 TRINITY_DN4296_c0_g1_i5:62-1180(-)